jgi:hypothetical protein
MYSTVAINQGGRPHIRFETRSQEDRAASVEQGRKIYKDVDWVIVTPQGARDFIENVASEWLKNIRSRSESGAYDPEWVSTFEKMYAMYKDGKEIPTEGTPLRMLSHLFTPAEIANCAALNVTTLEALAAINEETIGRLGMGAREWKSRAVEALKLSGQTDGAVRMSALETENNSLKDRLKDLEMVILDLQEKIASEAPARRPGRPPKE